MEDRPRALGRERLIAPILAAAIAVETPRTFVERLYSSYRNQVFSPLDRPELVFAPPLTAAIKEDERLAGGEVGFLDGDPLCDCQDTGGMNSRVVSFSSNGTRAIARVSVHFAKSRDRRDIRLTLVKTPAGWRIADIATSREASLLDDLQKANREARRR